MLLILFHDFIEGLNQPFTCCTTSQGLTIFALSTVGLHLGKSLVFANHRIFVSLLVFSWCGLQLVVILYSINPVPSHSGAVRMCTCYNSHWTRCNLSCNGKVWDHFNICHYVICINVCGSQCIWSKKGIRIRWCTWTFNLTWSASWISVPSIILIWLLIFKH